MRRKRVERARQRRTHSRYEELDWYETPRWYDAIFDVDTKAQANFLEACAERYGLARGRRVLEPACGSGRLVAEMARRGFTVSGFDRNATMLEFAKRRLGRRRAALFESDLAQFRVRQPHQLAHCLVSTFKYLLDERAARNHMRCVAKALAPGGLYVLGIHLTDYELEGSVRERWVVRKNGASIVCNTTLFAPDRRRRLESVRTRLRVTKRNGSVLRTQTDWLFRTYDAREMQTLLRSCPALQLVACHDFRHDIERAIDLDDDYLDKVLVLRKR